MAKRRSGKQRDSDSADSANTRWPLGTGPLCSHPGAAGPCMPRVYDGRCLWCERELPPVSAATDSDSADTK